MPNPTDQQAAQFALPGETWQEVRSRARRLLAAVVVCEPCGVNGCKGWIKVTDPLAYCERCSMADLWSYDPISGRERSDV
jgi:hypothetical protein